MNLRDLQFDFSDAQSFAGADAIAIASAPDFNGPPGFGTAVLKHAITPPDVDPLDIVAYALISFEVRDVAVVLSVHTAVKARRRGVASALYVAIEKHYAVRLRPSVAQTREGRALWRGMRKKGIM